MAGSEKVKNRKLNMPSLLAETTIDVYLMDDLFPTVAQCMCMCMCVKSPPPNDYLYLKTFAKFPLAG